MTQSEPVFDPVALAIVIKQLRRWYNEHRAALDGSALAVTESAGLPDPLDVPASAEAPNDGRLVRSQVTQHDEPATSQMA